MKKTLRTILDFSPLLIILAVIVAFSLYAMGCDEKNKQNPSETIITDPGARDIIGPILPSEEVLSIMQRVALQAKIDRQRTDLVNLEKEKNAEIERLKADKDAEIARLKAEGDAANERAAEHQRARNMIYRHWSWASLALIGLAVIGGFVWNWGKSIPLFLAAAAVAAWPRIQDDPDVHRATVYITIIMFLVVGTAALIYMWINWRTSQQANRKRELRKVKLMEGKIDEAEVLAAEAAVLDRVATKQYDHRIVEPTSEKKRKAA